MHLVENAKATNDWRDSPWRLPKYARRKAPSVVISTVLERRAEAMGRYRRS
jgi:hypothetical protein